MTVSNIYDEINKIAPFSYAENGDNVGLLIGSVDSDVKKVLLALDITREVAVEAIENGYDLIISHHPVIFKKLARLDDKNVAVMLSKHNISAICAHTNFDIADGGINDILVKMFPVEEKVDVLEVISEQNGKKVGIGRICNLQEEMSAERLAETTKNTLKTKVLRYNKPKKSLKKIAISCGYGGSRIYSAIEKGIDAIICGDVHHEHFIDAQNADVCVIDAGHFYTENVLVNYLKCVLGEKFSELVVDIARNNNDIIRYI